MRYRWNTACSLSLASIMRSAHASTRISLIPTRLELEKERATEARTHRCRRGARRAGAGSDRRARASPAGRELERESTSVRAHQNEGCGRWKKSRTMSVSAPRLGSER